MCVSQWLNDAKPQGDVEVVSTCTLLLKERCELAVTLQSSTMSVSLCNIVHWVMQSQVMGKR